MQVDGPSQPAAATVLAWLRLATCGLLREPQRAALCQDSATRKKSIGEVFSLREPCGNETLALMDIAWSVRPQPMNRTSGIVTLGVLISVSVALAQPRESGPPRVPEGTPVHLTNELRVRSFLPVKPVNRAQRPTPLLAVVENAGSADVTFRPKLLCPAGVHESRPLADGEATLKAGAQSKLSYEIQADRAGQGDLVLELWCGDKVATNTTLSMSFLPPAHFEKASYIPPPKPVKTTILVGAHNCPLWEADAPQMWD